MQNRPIIKKAFLATKNVASDLFLVTERFENTQGSSFVFYIIETPDSKIGKKLYNQINTSLVKEFLSDPNFSLSAFEKSLSELNKYIETGDIGDSSSTPVNIFVGLYENLSLHLSMIGSIEGYLIRKGKVNSLTEGLGSENNIIFDNITSGEIALNDTIIVGNNKFFDRLSLDRIRKTLELLSPCQAVKDFFKIFKKSKYQDVNAIIINATSNQEDKIEEGGIDFVYLDEKEESKLQYYFRVLKPPVEAIYKQIISFGNFVNQNLKRIASSVSEKWHTQYKPKTKEIIQITSKGTRTGISSIASNIDRNYKSKRSGLKVKSYTQKSGVVIEVFFSSIKIITKYINLATKKENRKYLYLFLILVFILFSYFKITSNNKNRDVVKKQNDSVYAIEQSQELLRSAEEDISLGRSNGIDKLNEALLLAKSAQETSSTSEKAKSIVNSILLKMDEITLTNRIDSSNPIFSFKNSISVIALTGSIIYGITEDGKIYSTDARDKDPRLVGAINNDMGKPISVVFSESSKNLFVLTDKPTIWAYDPLSQTGQEITLDGEAWPNGNDISAYSSNLYILDSIRGKIWRYSRSENGFSKSVSYAGSRSTDAEGGISMAIDGSIYILKTGGLITKFSQGNIEPPFTLNTPPQPQDSLEGASDIYTDTDSQNLFLLDKINNRVIKFAKDGEFIKQYTISDKTISHFLINPRIQKMWFVCDKEVYELDL